MASTNKQKALSALTLSALAIPGLSQAEVVPAKGEFSFRTTQYQESPAPAQRVGAGSDERYSIDVQQFHVLQPIAGKYTLSADVTLESMSGASPIQTYDDNGKSVLLMSGATIEEQRTDVSLAGKRYFSEATLGGTIATSQENDYSSLSFGMDGTLELFEKHTTLLAGLSISNDELSPTDASGLDSDPRTLADGQKKHGFSLYEGVSQVIDKYKVLQVGVGYNRLNGYLSDPYKGDVRPDLRESYTLTSQYRQYVKFGDGAAWHLDYRYYEDNWKVRSHTFTTAWWQDFRFGAYRLALAPNVRYYTQTQAYFYSLDLLPLTDYYSSDARLSTFGAVTVGLEAQFHWSSGHVDLGFQQYISSETLALLEQDNSETPGLVDFTTISLGLTLQY
ncbi:MAG: DUF3570 domain-containing protein [Oceanospirillaceae bacterium]|nr:DUF3570 domain-containing protein [Oceanospirillaceae bacterium]MCP5351543.1 DUF3570 domain-containing protein [Oceanospirillaceae bacterium]